MIFQNKPTLDQLTRMNRTLVALIVMVTTHAGMLAQTVTDRSPSPSHLARNQMALSLINFPWQDLQYDIEFLPPRPGIRALLISRERKIEIYARPGDDYRLIAFDIAHELGHAIDLTYNTDKSRQQWMALRGIDPHVAWFGCNRCSDYNTPAGDFAETFALLLLGPGQFGGRIAPPPATDLIPALSPFFPPLAHVKSAAF